MMNLGEMILQDRDRYIEPVESWEWPETDGKLFIGRMTGAERQLHAKAVDEHAGQWMAVNVAFCTFDAEGKPVFDRSAECIQKLAAQPATVLERITVAAVRVNGLSEESRRELRKNFASPAEPKSTSCSAGTSGSRGEYYTEYLTPGT